MTSLTHEADPFEALSAAVEANDSGRVAQLLEHYPELKARLDEPMPGSAFGATPLLGAASRRNREMIDILLHAGADINARSHWWAGSWGVLDRSDDLAPFLIERGALVDVHAAAQLGMRDRLEQLFSADPALVHARGGDGQTPLHFASSVEIAAYLLDHGADIDALDVDHESTPAQWMVRDRPEVARYLVTRGCRTDLLMAAALGDVELARRHLDADPACIRMSVTERYFPRQNPRSGGTTYIWQLGANRSAHQVARDFGHEPVLQLLMERSPAELKLAVACELGEEQLFRELLASRPDLINDLTDDDRRKIVDAAQNEQIEAVRLMLEAGWPVNARGQHGATALHWAAFHGNAAMARRILSHEPDLELIDTDYQGTPLSWGVYGSVHGWRRTTGDYAGTVEALLQAGAKVPQLGEDFEASDAVRAVLQRHAS